jgi:predicted transcriptional regulator
VARRRTKGLTDREAEILARLWEIGEASVEEIRPGLTEAPTASTVRKLLSIMVERQLVAADDRKYARRYRAVKDPQDLQAPALQRLLDTLFSGSAEGLVEVLLEVGRLTPADLRRLARRYGRRG